MLFIDVTSATLLLLGEMDSLCAIDLDVSDNEMETLLCDETLPESDGENEVRSDTPISAREQSVLDAYEKELDYYTYHMEMVETKISKVHSLLLASYPDTDFRDFNNGWFELHRWLTGEMNKMEFHLMHNNFGYDLIKTPPFHHPIRMRGPCVVRFNIHHAQGGWDVYHVDCIDWEDEKLMFNCGFSKGLITAEAPTHRDFIDNVIGMGRLVWCRKCEKFMFREIAYGTWNVFDRPSLGIWPKCESMIGAIGNVENLNYILIEANRCIARVLPTVILEEDTSEEEETDQSDIETDAVDE